MNASCHFYVVPYVVFVAARRGRRCSHYSIQMQAQRFRGEVTYSDVHIYQIIYQVTGSGPKCDVLPLCSIVLELNVSHSLIQCMYPAMSACSACELNRRCSYGHMSKSQLLPTEPCIEMKKDVLITSE